MNKRIVPQFSLRALSDVEAVVELERKVFKDPWTSQQFVQELNHEGSVCVTAVTDERVVIGYGIGRIVGDECEILRIAVGHEYRRMGIGRGILHELLHIAASGNVKTVYLELNRNNHAAYQLYRTIGFKNAYIRKRYYNNKDDAQVMVYCF